ARGGRPGGSGDRDGGARRRRGAPRLDEPMKRVRAPHVCSAQRSRASRRGGETMRRSATLLAIPMAVVLGLAMVTAPARAGAHYAYDPSVDFSKYHSFRWICDGPFAAQHAQRGREPPAEISPLSQKQIAE